MGRKAEGKPRGRMSAYAFFVQTCREEHKKKHPGESVVFAEFSRKCSEKWRVLKSMNAKDKRRFDEMAEKDKVRYDREMENYQPTDGSKKRRRKTKDPNAPKRALSAFFFFCAEERGSVKAAYPSYGVGEIAKELGKRWEKCPNREKFDALAVKDKARYEKAMIEYRKTGGGAPQSAAAVKKQKLAAAAAAAAAAKEEEEEEDDDDEEEEEDDDDEEEDDE